MRRKGFAALMITLLLLCGCGGEKNEARFEAFRAELAAASELGMTAELTAETEDSSRQYTLALTRTPEGSLVEVLAPELIRGVKARVENGGGTLEYDGVILDTGTLTEDGLTPVSALPRLVETILTGHVDRTWKEGDLLVVQLTPDDVCTVTLWLDARTLTPESAELADRSGGVLVRCGITQFQYT